MMVGVDRALQRSGGPCFLANEVSTKAISFISNDDFETELLVVSAQQQVV